MLSLWLLICLALSTLLPPVPPVFVSLWLKPICLGSYCLLSSVSGWHLTAKFVSDWCLTWCSQGLRLCNMHIISCQVHCMYVILFGCSSYTWKFTIWSAHSAYLAKQSKEDPVTPLFSCFGSAHDRYSGLDLQNWRFLCRQTKPITFPLVHVHRVIRCHIYQLILIYCMCFHTYRWRKQASTTVAQPKLLTGSAVLSAIKTWRDGSLRITHGEPNYLVLLSCYHEWDLAGRDTLVWSSWIYQIGE